VKLWTVTSGKHTGKDKKNNYPFYLFFSTAALVLSGPQRHGAVAEPPYRRGGAAAPSYRRARPQEPPVFFWRPLHFAALRQASMVACSREMELKRGRTQ